MRSEKQREASRSNGAKSKGPKSPEGKAVSSMNGLKHGLRANQVVLPGEDAAEFQAELEGWAGDWKPTCHTGAILVERAAVASWRLRRCVRAEKELLIEIAARGDDQPEGDDDSFDVEAVYRIDEAADALGSEPQRCLAVLRSLPGGVDRLIGLWEKLDEALADGPGGWDLHAHKDLLPLLGHKFDADPAAAGPLAEASHRLFLDGRRRVEEDKPEGLMTDGEIDEVIEELRRATAGEIKTLRAARRAASPGAEPADLRRRRREVHGRDARADAHAPLRDGARAVAEGGDQGPGGAGEGAAGPRRGQDARSRPKMLSRYVEHRRLRPDRPSAVSAAATASERSPEPSAASPAAVEAAIGVRPDAPIGGPEAPISAAPRGGGGGSRR